MALSAVSLSKIYVADAPSIIFYFQSPIKVLIF